VVPTTFEGRPTLALFFVPAKQEVRETVATYRLDGKWYMQPIRRYGHAATSGGMGVGWKITWEPKHEAFTLVTDEETIATFDEQLAIYQRFGFREDPGGDRPTNMSGTLQEMREWEEAERRRVESGKPVKQKVTW
jgi:hypothetical protein